MQASLRKTLADSHVAAVAIAVLLYLSLSAAFWALWGFVDGFLYAFASENFATHKILSEELANLPVRLSILFSALVCVLAAWLLSRWVYGVGPLRTLGSYRNKFSRKTHA